MNNQKEILMVDIKEFQQSFYDYLSNEVQNILEHLKQDLPIEKQREVERVMETLEYLAEQLKDFNKSINELLFEGDKE